EERIEGLEEAEEEDLEAEEQNEDPEQDPRLTLGGQQEGGDRDPEEREDREVEDGVPHDDVEFRNELLRIAKPLQDRRPQERGRVERPETNGVVQQEPDRDHRAAEKSGRDALADDVDPAADQAPRETRVAPVEVVEHREGGDEVAGQDLPPGQYTQHRQGPERDQRQEEDLERREEDKKREDHRRLALGAGHEIRGDEAHDDEPES